MAASCKRAVGKLWNRLFSATPKKQGFLDGPMPDPMDLATGLEKKQLLALQAGNDDPFHMKAIKRGPGTKDNPNLVPSFVNSRIVGCLCEEDSMSISWMWLHEGTPRRCYCGHWFKLVRKPPL